MSKKKPQRNANDADDGGRRRERPARVQPVVEPPHLRAARNYLQEKVAYRAAMSAIETVADPAIQQWAKEALTARVRAKFGNIGRGLTRQFGCHFSALPNGHSGKPEFEHAIPLNLLHNRMLGLTHNGRLIEGWTDEYLTLAQIETFLRLFVIGVEVTEIQHAQLKKKDMPSSWKWLADFEAWDWDQVAAARWHFPGRPDWLKSLMGRYEEVAAPHGPIEYWPRR